MSNNGNNSNVRDITSARIQAAIHKCKTHSGSLMQKAMKLSAARDVFYQTLVLRMDASELEFVAKVVETAALTVQYIEKKVEVGIGALEAATTYVESEADARNACTVEDAVKMFDKPKGKAKAKPSAKSATAGN